MVKLKNPGKKPPRHKQKINPDYSRVDGI